MERPLGISAGPSREACLKVWHSFLHQSLNCWGRWGTTDDFATSFLYFGPSQKVCLQRLALLVTYFLHLHLTLNRGNRWDTKDDFTISFLLFPLFSTALWDLANSRPVHPLMLSSHLFLCLPCLLPPFTVPCKIVLARTDERETCPYHCS